VRIYNFSEARFGSFASRSSHSTAGIRRNLTLDQVITLVWDECGRSALPAASAAEVHSIPDIHAAVSDEFGATYVYSGAFGRLGHAQPCIDGRCGPKPSIGGMRRSARTRYSAQPFDIHLCYAVEIVE
jgi:hypothetical protein